jgi:hypothetical protein
MARGIGMSGRRRSQTLDAVIGQLEDAGYLLAAQKINDIRESEWDLGQDHASMSAESVRHLAAFISEYGMNGRLPIVVHQSGMVALDWDDRRGHRLSLIFLDDGRVEYTATIPASAANNEPEASGTDTPEAAVALAKETGMWDWAIKEA